MRRVAWFLTLAFCCWGIFATISPRAQTFPPGVLLSRGALDPAPGGGGGNVTRDVIGTDKYQATSNSFSYTGLTITGSLTKPALVCWVLRADSTNDIATGLSLTWGSQGMTLVEGESGVANTDGAFLFGLRNPTSGNQTLSVSATNSARDNFVNCTSFFNVNQTSDAAAFPNGTKNTNVTSLSVTSASGHIAVGAFDNGSNNGTILGTTVISDASSGAIINAAGDYVVSSGSSTTVGTTTNQNNMAGMDISN